MQHVESTIKVCYTKEYARFRMIQGNRQLNNAKIKRIEKDISNGLDVLRYCPILVNENAKGQLDIIEALCRIMNAGKIKPVTLWEKYERDPKQLRKCSNGKEYLNELELLYNQGAKIRKRFTDGRQDHALSKAVRHA